MEFFQNGILKLIVSYFIPIWGKMVTKRGGGGIRERQKP